MSRQVSGPLLTAEVVGATGAPLSGVTITPSATVYTDKEFTAAVSTLTTNGAGVFSAYAPPGIYTFTCSDSSAKPIEPIEILSSDQGGTSVSGSVAAAIAAEVARAGAAYVPAKVCAVAGDGATDDATTIQTQATGGGHVVIPKGSTGTVVVGSTVLVPSGTTVELKPGVRITRKTGFYGNLIANSASQSQRTVVDAVVTSASQTITSATAAFVAGDVGKLFTLTGASAGTGSVSGTITAVTNSTTATISVTPGASSTGNVLCIYAARDSDISFIFGEGSGIDGVDNSGAGTVPATHHVRLRHIDRLSIVGGKHTSTVGGKYIFALSDVTNFTVHDINFPSTTSDGVHVNGPASLGEIYNIGGATGDDLVALIPNDYVGYNETAGDITDVTVRDLFPQMGVSSPGRAFAVTNGLGCIAKRLLVDGIFGVAGAHAVLAGSDGSSPNTDAGILDDFTARNIHCKPGAGSQILYCNPVAGGSFTLDGYSWDSANSTPLGAVYVPVGSVIAGLTVKSGNIVSVNNAPGVRVDGTVTDLTIDGFRGGLPSQWLLLLGNAASNIARVSFSRIRMTSGSGAVQAVTAGQSMPSVSITDSQFPGISLYTMDIGTATTLYMTNVISARNFSVRSGGNLRVVALACSIATSGVTITGTLSSGGFGYTIDISLLAKNVGDMATNSNGGLSCGLGPVICTNTGSAPNWKNLATAATY